MFCLRASVLGGCFFRLEKRVDVFRDLRRDVFLCPCLDTSSS